MSFTPETLLRHWQTLRLIRRYPKNTTAAELCSSLEAEGFKISKRTVERDLQALSRIFPLLVDERSKPFGWSWEKDAPAFDLPGISLSESLTLLMAREHLQAVMPSSTVCQMNPYFRLAEQKLKALEGRSGVAAWLDKVRIVPASQPLISPPVDTQVLASIQQALLENRQCQVAYRKRDVGAADAYPIHPLGLIQRGQVLYLACTIKTYQDIRLLALHRTQAASVLDLPAIAPEKFNLDDYLASGAMGWSTTKPIALVAAFAPETGTHLQETPLSKDQVIEYLPDGRLEVRATVIETQQLLWWLLGFGDGVEVMAPQALRDKISDKVNRLVERYADRAMCQ
ncbi:MAG: WYL domain-containing protein [Candidatus Accumulibacter sp. UW25]|jgi:predicted DNA-binding transcriptional regulator YafY